MSNLRTLQIIPFLLFVIVSSFAFGVDYDYSNGTWTPSDPNGSFTANNTYYINDVLDLSGTSITVYDVALLILNDEILFKSAVFEADAQVIVNETGQISALESGGLVENYGVIEIEGTVKIQNSGFVNYTSGFVVVNGPLPGGILQVLGADFDNYGFVYCAFGNGEVKFRGGDLTLHANSTFDMDGQVIIRNADVLIYGSVTGIGWFRLEQSNITDPDYRIFLYSGGDINGDANPTLVNIGDDVDIARILYPGYDVVFANDSSHFNNLSCTDVVFVLGDVYLSTDYTVGALLVYPSIYLELDPNSSLTVCNDIVNEGYILIYENGSLVQSTNTTNEGYGTYVVERQSGDSSHAYNVWSSPINQAELSTVFTDMNPCDIYAYDPVSQEFGYDFPSGYSTTCDGSPYTFTNWLIPSADGVMDVGAGYFVPGNGNQHVYFQGEVNNGPVSVSVYQTSGGTYESWNLLGNPFPCAIDVLSLYNLSNNSTLFDGSVYFWVDDNSAGTNYHESDDYAVTNGSTVVGANGVTPSTVVPSGQGFWIQATQSGTFQFDNTIRIGGG